MLKYVSQSLHFTLYGSKHDPRISPKYHFSLSSLYRDLAGFSSAYNEYLSPKSCSTKQTWLISSFPCGYFIVDTVKGWLGLGPKGELPIPETDKPKKDWLTSLTDFLIPQWIRDFAKDALGTVTGWLGLTTTDDQGNITSTNFGKLVCFERVVATTSTGRLLSNPPSTSSESPYETGLNTVGIVNDALTASVSEPLLKTTSVPVSKSEATHLYGIGKSSKL